MSQGSRELGDREIHESSATILRIGVVASAAVMLAGLALSLVKDGLTVEEMAARPFGTDYRGVLAAAMRGDGVSLVECGIFLLVLTPIMRVAVSVAIFAFVERDWLYTAVTLLVLTLTVSSLLILR